MAEILLANRLPPSLFQAYHGSSTDELSAIPLSTVLSELPQDHQVVLRCIRNTDISTVRNTQPVRGRLDSDPVADLVHAEHGQHQPLGIVHRLSAATFQEVVTENIVQFLREQAITTPIVAGISGGGDSNTLVRGLKAFADRDGHPASKIVCFTLAMDPLWPETAVDRARALCADAGSEHRVLYAKDMTDLMGMSDSPAQLWEKFRRDYGPDTVHFFGTCFVNLVGRRLCEQLGATNLCVGYNREDLMAELLFCLINGRRPLPYPVRRMGQTNCLFPLWQMPKYMLDACYPHYSASNYRERVDATTPQRSAIYFLAHCLDALSPQLSLSVMKGVAGLMDELDGWKQLTPVTGTPLMRTPHSSPEHEQQVLELLRQYFPAWSTS
ncbi:MAG: hypothetical protein JO115_00115 [Pseudonocardiales bacterium]|nr:hypothetical protein [Pseudonocardiales bacterium]